MRQEAKLGAGLGITQEVLVLGAADEQHTLAHTRPGVRLRAAMVGKHDYLDARGLRPDENFRPGALGVRRVLGVNMEDSAVIVVHTRLRERFPFLRELQPRLVNSLEVRHVEPFDGGVLAAGAWDIGEESNGRKRG